VSKVVILTNDLQYELVNKNQERIDAVQKFKNKFCDFLNNMRSLGIPIIHLQLINDPKDHTAERYGDHLPVTKGSDGAKILGDFLSDVDIIIEKNKDSGFYETNLDATLKKLGVETVIVTGMQTQICVQTTAADAFFRGYKVVVPTDGVVSAKEEDKKRALDWLGGYFAQITTTDEIYKHLLSHDDFDRKQVVIP
jgi:nicotinamidase-related amidase